MHRNQHNACAMNNLESFYWRALGFFVGLAACTALIIVMWLTRQAWEAAL